MRATPLPAFAPATILTLLATLLVSDPAHARGLGPGGDDESSSWGLGIGVASSQQPYAGIGRETKAIPLIRFENKYVRVQGLGMEVKLPSRVISDTQRFDFSIVGRRAPGDGYEADDAPILAGMAERKSGFWAGAKVEWENSLINVSADWTSDVSGHSKGQKFSLGFSRPWHLGQQWKLVPSLEVAWQDRKYNDYYFGVRDSEARPGRAAYQADVGVNVEIGLSGMYMFDKHHSVMLGVGASSLPKEIKNSPLVDRSTENRVFMAYTYRF